MAARINEKTQFVDSAGKPLVNGKVYIGVQGADPEVSPITIYSDRALATPLANPQTLDANGRSTNKIWIPAEYSIKIKDSDGVQVMIDLDAGSASTIGLSVLSSVLGTNTITANASPTLTAYVDQSLYSFRVAVTNTGPVTLNIDGLGAKSILKNNTEPIGAGHFVAGEDVLVQYNANTGQFNLINKTRRWNYSAITSDPTVDVEDSNKFFSCSGSSFTISTVACANLRKDFMFAVKFDGEPGTDVYTVNPNAAETVDGKPTYVIDKEGQCVVFLCDGSNLKVVSDTHYRGNTIPTGAGMDHWGTTAPEGWVLAEGGTLGDAGSGATERADSDTEALFILLWNTLADAQAPVSTGRGGSAKADFDAGKTITLPDKRERVSVPFKTGGTFDPKGATGGVETVTLTQAQTPLKAHTHQQRVYKSTFSGAAILWSAGGGGTAGEGDDNLDTASVGDASADPHTNLQPYMVTPSYIIKL